MGEVAENLPTLMFRPSKQIVDSKTKLAIRTLIAAAETEMAQPERNLDIPPQVDHFADGMYARELHMPAGMLITSKIHKTNHFCFVLKGVAQVVDENSGGELIVAPCMITTKAGTKRLLRILEDSVWVTVHATEKTDVSEIEKDIISEHHLDLIEVNE